MNKIISFKSFYFLLLTFFIEIQHAVAQLQIQTIENGKTELHTPITEANSALNFRKNELIKARNKFQSAIDSLSSISTDTSSQSLKIEALNAGINSITIQIDSITSAIDRLNKFEDSKEKTYTFNDDILSINIKKPENFISSKQLDSIIAKRLEGKLIDPILKFNGTFGGISFRWDALTNSDFGFSAPEGAEYLEQRIARGFGMDYTLNIRPIQITRKCGLFITGNIEINHYSFRNTFDFVVKDETITIDYTKQQQGIKFKRFNLRTIAFNIPIDFQIDIPIHRNILAIDLGIEGGIRCFNRTKQIWIDDNKDRNKQIKYSDLTIQQWKYSLLAGIGYKGISLTCQYTPTPLFKKGTLPEVYPLAVGIKINTKLLNKILDKMESL
ncbi:MAG: hypothetical protein IKQ46_03955 [Bacteroidales bacterium]|nr:hypothetical protein [Bacteroidales bacterium]